MTLSVKAGGEPQVVGGELTIRRYFALDNY
jgi:hypothetical protein